MSMVMGAGGIVIAPLPAGFAGFTGALLPAALGAGWVFTGAAAPAAPLAGVGALGVLPCVAGGVIAVAGVLGCVA
ncbi:MAG TPA: hypothetical protein VJV78_21315 [Polyangiales bacterium]|nr:hypothetical protein [Polyangiales bacterium]